MTIEEKYELLAHRHRRLRIASQRVLDEATAIGNPEAPASSVSMASRRPPAWPG
jgi:hypothetical protein